MEDLGAIITDLWGPQGREVSQCSDQASEQSLLTPRSSSTLLSFVQVVVAFDVKFYKAFSLGGVGGTRHSSLPVDECSLLFAGDMRTS